MKTINILLAEDNQGDVLLAEIAFETANIKANIISTEDGEVTINALFKKKGYESLITPDVIILDLNIPKISGKEILAQIKSSTNLKAIPVVILTSSEAYNDIEEAKKLQVNAYMTKPLDSQKCAEIYKLCS